MEASRKITVSDMYRVLNTMNVYKKNDGFIAFVGDKLTLFDTVPSFGAAFITIEEVEKFIKDNE